jgi:hypothetical protein
MASNFFCLRASSIKQRPRTHDHAARPYADPCTYIRTASVSPDELVDYIAQNGDTLPALAAHFNITVEEIM